MLLLPILLGMASVAVVRQEVVASDQHNLSLTLQERDFLKEHPVLKLGVGVAFPPFQFVEEVDGRHHFKGIVSDTLRLLERRLGVRMEPVFGISFSRALEMGRRGEIDLFPCLSWTPERAEFLSYTKSYISYPVVIITRDDAPFIGSLEDLRGHRVADVKALSTYSRFVNEHPGLDVDFVFVKNTSEMLEAVSLGMADACTVNLAVASYLISKLGLSNLKVAAPTTWGEEGLAMAVPKDRAILASIMQKALDSLTYEERENIRQRWLGVKYSPLTNPVLFWRVLLQGGALVLLVLAVILWWNRRLRREVAERKRVEEALRESEERLRTLIDAMPDIVCFKDAQGRWLEANVFDLDLFQLAGVDYRNKKDSELAEFSPFYSEAFLTCEESDEKAWTAGGVSRGEEVIPRPDGSPLVFDIIKAPTFHPDGRRKGLVVVGRDITERKKAEEALLEKTEQLTLVLDGGQLGYWDWNLETGEVRRNERWASMLGYALDDVEFTVKQWEDFLHPDDRDAAWRSIQDHLEGRTSMHKAEYRLRAKDGTYRWVLDQAKVVGRDPAGKALRMCGTHTDMTARKAMEHKLIEATRKADGANRAKTEFLANMSHEIRTPLNGVMSMLQLLQTTSMTEEQKKYVDVSLGSSRNLLQLLCDILDISRIEAGRLELEKERFTLGEVIVPIMNFLSDQADQKGIDLFCDISSEISGNLLGDPLRIRQILFNLLVNAIKFTDSGRVSLEIQPLPLGGIDRAFTALLVVSDTGPGIPDDKLDSVFDIFTQADGSYTRRHGGVGLGLSIVRRLVHMMGGNICVASDAQSGTTFYVTLRLEWLEEAKEPVLEKTAPAIFGEPPSWRVLVVEDDSVNRYAALEVFKKMHIAVEAVENGEKALMIMSEQDFDLILMDIQMPVLDGIRATEAIRAGQAGERNKNIPIIAMTAHAMATDRETFLAAGMDAYLAKPIDMKALWEVMENVMKKRRFEA